MAIELDPDLVLEVRVDRCPECGCVWPGGVPEHVHDCRYYSDEGEEDDDLLCVPVQSAPDPRASTADGFRGRTRMPPA